MKLMTSWVGCFTFFSGITLAVNFGLMAKVQAATLLNDNFDAVPLGAYSGSFDSSFYVSTGKIDVSGQGSNDFYPGNGNYIDLNGDRQGGITSNSSFTFSPGQSATLSFSYGTNKDGGIPNSAQVILGGVVIDQLKSTDLIGTGLNNVTLNIANPNNGTLSFLSTTPGFYGIIIDNIVLNSSPTSVPEPFTVIGTLIGGTAAFHMRKKLKATSDPRS
jgi:hypothetical protein